MHLNDYANEAMKTAVYPIDQGIVYASLGLASEAGEVAGKVKKILRDNEGVFTPDARKAIADEAADCLWYIAALARELGVSMEAMAHSNLDKLNSRKERGVLGGSGDSR